MSRQSDATPCPSLPEEIARLMDPKNYIGSATEMAKKVLSTLDRKL